MPDIVTLIIIGIFFCFLCSLPGIMYKKSKDTPREILIFFGFVAMFFGAIPWIIYVVLAFASRFDDTMDKVEEANEMIRKQKIELGLD